MVTMVMDGLLMGSLATAAGSAWPRKERGSCHAVHVRGRAGQFQAWSSGGGTN